MALSGKQITDLANVIDGAIDHARLEMLASNIGINLKNDYPGLSLRDRAHKLLCDLSAQSPPRDRDLLQALQSSNNKALRDAATELLTPPYFAPNNDPHNAILLGRIAFVDRLNLRSELRQFTNYSATSTRVLVVRGDDPSGKSYSWEFLRHLALNVAGAVPRPLRLKNSGYTPRQMFEEIFRLLNLDASALPVLADEPQLARIDPLLNALAGQLVELKARYWLAIDDLNDRSVTPTMCETAFAIARLVEDLKPPHLWVMLLGYNEAITDSELRYIAQDDARFPDVAVVGRHFQQLSEASAAPLEAAEADGYAKTVFAQYPALDKTAMIRLTAEIERVGAKLIQGLRP